MKLLLLLVRIRKVENNDKKKKDVKESLDLVYLALETFTVHMLLV